MGCMQSDFYDTTRRYYDHTHAEWFDIFARTWTARSESEQGTLSSNVKLTR